MVLLAIWLFTRDLDQLGSQLLQLGGPGPGPGPALAPGPEMGAPVDPFISPSAWQPQQAQQQQKAAAAAVALPPLAWLGRWVALRLAAAQAPPPLP